MCDIQFLYDTINYNRCVSHFFETSVSYQMAKVVSKTENGNVQSLSEKEYTLRERAGAALLYGGCSLVLVLSNKICLTTYRFPDAIILALSQCISTLGILLAGSYLGKIELDFSVSQFKTLSNLCFVNAINVGTGLIGTKSVNIPMFTALRRLSILLTMLAQAFILKQKPTKTVIFSVFLMCGGALLAAIYDLAFNLFGYVAILMSASSTALSNVLTKSKFQKTKTSKWNMLLYNNLVALPVFLFAIYARNSWQKAQDFPEWDNPSFMLSFFASSILGIVLQFTILYAIQVNGALALTVTGLLKNVLSSYIGMLGIGGDYAFSWLNFLGINISMVGGMLYSRAKYLDAKQGTKPAPKNSSNDNRPAKQV